MTAPADEDLTCYQGAAFSKSLLWKDSGGTPVPLAGYTARMQIRRTVDEEGDPILSLTTANGRITLGPGDGEILLEISATDTASLPATLSDRKWRYDLEMVPAGGAVRRLMQGKFVVSLEVTR